MKITQDRSKKLLCLFQQSYVETLLERFNMHKAKPVCMPLAGHFKLCMEQSPTSEKEKAKLKNLPYSSVVASLMYDMICNSPDLLML